MATPEKIRNLARFVHDLNGLTIDAFGAFPDHEAQTVHDHLFKVLQSARSRLVRYLAYNGDMLVGAEYCNECGELEGTVTRIELEPDLMIVTNGASVCISEIDNGDEAARLP